MSPGALYRYFPSKVSIIAAIAEAERAEAHRLLRAPRRRPRTPSRPSPASASTSSSSCSPAETPPFAPRPWQKPSATPKSAACSTATRPRPAPTSSPPSSRGQTKRHRRPRRSTSRPPASSSWPWATAFACTRASTPPSPPPRIRPVLQQLLRRFLRPAAVLLLLLHPPVRPSRRSPARPSVTVVAATTGAIAETVTLTGTLVAKRGGPRQPATRSARHHRTPRRGRRPRRGQPGPRPPLQGRAGRHHRPERRPDRPRRRRHRPVPRPPLPRARPTATQVDLALARTRDLLSGGNASRETFEQRQAAALAWAPPASTPTRTRSNSPRPTATLAQAQRQELLVRLARTDIRAPVAGIVSRRTARLGAVVAGSRRPLFRIIQDGAVELEADVPELQLAKPPPRPARPHRNRLAGTPATGPATSASSPPR